MNANLYSSVRKWCFICSLVSKVHDISPHFFFITNASYDSMITLPVMRYENAAYNYVVIIYIKA